MAEKKEIKKEEKKPEESRRKGGGMVEKIDRVVSFGTALFTIPIIGVAIKEVVDQYGKHAAKKIAGSLGLTTEEADKGIDDEALFASAVLHDDFVSYFDRMTKFLEWLRGEDANLAKAFVLYVAKVIQKFSPDKDLKLGIQIALRFMEKLIDIPNNDDRVKYLKAWNVQSLIAPPKPDPLGVAKDFVEKQQAVNLKNLGEQTKSFREKAAEFRRNRGR